MSCGNRRFERTAPKGIFPSPIMSTNLIRIRLNTRKFNPLLLGRLFNNSSLIAQHKDDECRGTSRDFFTQKILNKLSIPVPPIDEQERMLKSLENDNFRIDNLREHKVHSTKKIDAMMPAILDRAFRGEL
jgi:type I restriction enzyme S subunit